MERSVIFTRGVLAAMMILGSGGAAHAQWTRQDALNLARQYAEHQWTCGANNTRASCSSNYTCDWTAGQRVTGLPYDWGGYKTIAQFETDLRNGQAAGSHKVHGVLSCTTGVDCSGYVSQVWRIGHNSTSTMHNVSRTISRSEVLPADAFNDAGSHIVLFVSYLANGAPQYYEAAGGAKKVRLNTTGGWRYLDGYTPIRVNGFANQTTPPNPGPTPTPTGPAGTVDDPIIVNRFPYSDNRDTTFARSDRFNVYNCATDKRQNGGEYLYRIEVPSAGSLTASVSDGTGVDVDVHFLTSPDANACITRNDVTVTTSVQGRGTIWLSVDTWTNSSGVEYPGPYSLTINFTARPGGTTDAGAADSGLRDTGSFDFGSGFNPEQDSGVRDTGSTADTGVKDAGPAFDAGSKDAGTGTKDAGAFDAGSGVKDAGSTTKDAGTGTKDAGTVPDGNTVIDVPVTKDGGEPDPNDPGDPGTDPGDPGTDPGDPGADPGDPGADPGSGGIDPNDKPEGDAPLPTEDDPEPPAPPAPRAGDNEEEEDVDAGVAGDRGRKTTPPQASDGFTSTPRNPFEGCNCAVGGSQPSASAWLWLLACAPVALLRRRRRRL
ncbi:MAG: hypothetical protein GMKNLPBB_02215 [Myxococcota bacterium]|nr:hypothetical protein [Myxococcota bacterium]